jgi:hypothetical protein
VNKDCFQLLYHFLYLLFNVCVRADRGWDTLTSKGKPWNWTKLLILSLGLLASMFFLSLMALSTARMMMPYPKSASCQVNV